MSDTHTTGASVDLPFADGTVYRMAPLSDRSISELDEWVRSRHINMAKNATEDMPQEDADRIIGIAMEQAAGMSWMSGLGARLIATVDGMSRIVWQSIKDNHPDVTLEQIRAKMFDPKNVEEVNRVFARVNPSSKVKGRRAGDKRRKLKKRKHIERLRRRTGGRGRR